MSAGRTCNGATALPQRGFALIAILMLAAMIAAFLIAIGLNRSGAELQNEREDRNMSVLRQAKTALISYAASEQWQAYKGQTTNQPGGLPCPDIATNTGTSPGGICSGAASRVGRLPFATIGADDLKDASGERLWYAVSSNFYKRTGAGGNVINSDTPGLLTVQGSAPASNVVAIVFAPGIPVLDSTTGAIQDRSGANVFRMASYLENVTAVGSDYTFTSNTRPSDIFNDRLLVITQADLMAAVEPVVAARVERDIKPLFITYNSQWGGFPYPANFGLGPGTSGGNTTRSPMAFFGDTTQTAGLVPISAVPVSNASNNSPIIITTASPHTSSTGDLVWVYGVQGNTAANNEFIVTKIDSTHLILNSSSGNGNYTGGGDVTITYPWSLESVTQAGGSGRIDNLSCGQVSNPFNGLKCTFRARDDNCGSNNCISNLGFQLQAQAGTSVGRTLAVLPDLTTINSNTTLDGNPTTFFSASIAGQLLNSSGLGLVTYSATLPSSLNCINTCTNHTVVVTFPDVTTNRFISATDPTVGWFIANEWYRQTYYAVAPAMLPGGSGDCGAPPPCLTVNNLPRGTVANGQAILLLAGRALNGSSRPSALLSDYLEQAAPPTSTYANRTGTPTSINDRVVVVAP